MAKFCYLSLVAGLERKVDENEKYQEKTGKKDSRYQGKVYPLKSTIFSEINSPMKLPRSSGIFFSPLN